MSGGSYDAAVAAGRAGRLAIGGLLGPAAFVSAWTAGSIQSRSRGYSAVSDAISRLAAVGAPTRPLMTAGFVGFGLAVPVYAVALERWLPTRAGAAAAAAAVSGVATLAVAALPLDHSASVDRWHGIAAGIGYIGLAATPLLAAPALAREGHTAAARASWAAGLASSACLVATLAGSAHGLFQRLGLTVGDVWIAASAVAILRGRPGGRAVSG